MKINYKPDLSLVVGLLAIFIILCPFFVPLLLGIGSSRR